jgi:hypothetical protein
MKRRRQFARLNHINRLLAAKHSSDQAAIDLALARQIREDIKRVDHLDYGKLPNHRALRALTSSELEERSRLQERIRANSATFGCRTGYGMKECNADEDRLREMSYIGPRNEKEDTEQALLTARVSAFWATSEGQARRRIAKLAGQSFWASTRAKGFSRSGPPPLTSDEQEELDRLQARYPHVPTRAQILMAEKMEKQRQASDK